MSYKSKGQLESHDAAGYETAYTDFSEYSDGYGNKVEHGDLTVQRIVEVGYRDAQILDPEKDRPPVEGYDKHPFMSKAQHRKFRSMEARGEIPSGTASRWAHHTPGGVKNLPEHK